MPVGQIIGGIGSALGGIFGAGAAQDAAAQQVRGLRAGVDYTNQAANNALNFSNQIYNQAGQNYNPYMQAGYGGLSNLSYLLGIGSPGNYPTQGTGGYNPGTPGLNPAVMGTGRGNQMSTAGEGTAMAGTPGQVGPNATGNSPLSSLVNPALGGFGSLAQGWTGRFQAPTDVTEQNDPGYKFRLQQGVNALQNSAAASGSLLNGGTAAGINAYGQDYASNEYNNVYNRALGQYQQQYGEFMNNQQNLYNRLSALTGLGYNATGAVQGAGQYAAGLNSNILQNAANQISGLYGNIGTAQAGGTIGAQNSYNSMIGPLSSLAYQGIKSIPGFPGGNTNPYNGPSPYGT